jgi:putative MATE family efflux protein
MKTDFSVGKVSTRIMYQALPLMLARTVQLLYSIVDRIYLGHLSGIGTMALTGVGLAFPVTTLIAAITYWFGNGGTPFFSIARGKKNDDEAEHIIGQSVTMLVAASVLAFAFCYYFRKPILYLFGASDASYIYADQYLKVYLLGTLFSMFSVGMNGYINAQGFPKIGMLTTMIGCVLNLILDPVFIFLLHLGVKGAAAATVISQFVSAVWVLRFFTGPGERPEGPVYRIKLKHMIPDLPVMRRITSMGFADFIMMSTNCLNQVLCNAVLQIYGGDLYVGVMTIINSVRGVVEMPAGCVTSASQPVIGYNYGAKEFERVKKGIMFTLKAALVATGAFWLLILLVPGAFIGLFTSDPSIHEIGVPAMRQFFMCMVFMAFQYTGQSTFKALGCAKRAIFFSLFRKAIVIMPLVILLPRTGLGAAGVFYAEPISNLFCSLICFATMYFTVYRKLGN